MLRIAWNRKEFLWPEALGVLVMVYYCSYCLLLVEFFNILSVLWIYVYCEDLYVQYSLQDSGLWRSAAQMVDGNLKVTAPGFDLVLPIYWMRPRGLK